MALLFVTIYHKPGTEDALRSYFIPQWVMYYFFNDTDSEITVDTFNQNDAIRWVSYERRIVAPHQAALHAARGHDSCSCLRPWQK